MGKHFFMKPALDWLAKPAHLNRVMAITMRSVAVLVVPLSLVTFFKAGKVIFELPASEILGGIFFEIAYVVAVYCVVHGLFIRAQDVDRLKADDFNMFPLASIIIRSIGETGAAYLGCVSIGAGVYVWFTAKSIKTLLDPLPTLLPVFGGTNFIGGIQFMMAGLLSAIALLGIAYLVAEALTLVHAAARRQEESRILASSPPVIEEEPAEIRRTGSTG